MGKANLIKRSGFGKKHVWMILACVMLAGGVLAYKEYDLLQEEKDDALSSFEDRIPLQCENGQWTEFPDLETAKGRDIFSGPVRFVYDASKNIFFNSGNGMIFTTDSQYSLSFFSGRDVQVEGYELSDNSVYVKRAKCVGAEADKTVQLDRQKLMNYVQGHINDLAPERSDNGAWQVETFFFVNDTDFYVQYETSGSFLEEAPYDARLWLARFSGWNGSVPELTVLAYIQESPEGFDKNFVKQGEDIYKNVKDMTIYEFDDDLKQWVLQ